MINEQLEMARTHVCSECQGNLTLAVNTADGKDWLRCAADKTHTGYSPKKSLTQLHDEGVFIPHVSEKIETKRRQELEAVVDPEVSRELMKYNEQMPITVAAAHRAVMGMYPKASSEAQQRLIMICAQHNLNPLTKEAIIISFWNKKDQRYDDEVILKITGNRKMARRRSPFIIKDGPRLMTQAEKEMFVDDTEREGKIWAIVYYEQPDGNVIRGQGFWKKDEEPYGTDKGNTKTNMAFIHAERNGLARILPPSELPAPVEFIIDAVYADITELPESAPAKAIASSAKSASLAAKPAGQVLEGQAQVVKDKPKQAPKDEPQSGNGGGANLTRYKDKTGNIYVESDRGHKSHDKCGGFVQPLDAGLTCRKCGVIFEEPIVMMLPF